VRFERALLASTMGLIVLSGGLSLSVITLTLGADLRARESEALGTDHRILARFIKQRRDLLEGEARMLADEPRLRAVAATEDVTRETVDDVLVDVARTSGTTRLILADSAGDLLGVVQERSDAPVPHALIEQALLSGSAHEVTHDREPVELQAQRIAYGQRVVGVVVVGRRFLAEAVAEAHHQTGAVFVVEHEGQLVAWAPREGPRAPPEATLRELVGLSRPSAERVSAGPTLGGDAETYLREAHALHGDVHVVAARSWDEARAPLVRLVVLLVVVSLFVAMGCALVVRRVAHRLGEPLGELVGFARRIASADAGARTLPRGLDEVAALGVEMNRMAEQLETGREVMLHTQRLEQEMSIAASIQTSLLPPQPRLEGLELAAQMLPASEVGGDYFDIRATPEGGWIGVGDVTGHGLPAGLIMLMTQTATAALTAGGVTDPREVVVRLNALLHENIRQRLGRDDHVTYSLFHYDKRGQLAFAGAHEPVLVYRRAQGRCEHIDTPGAWLGAIPRLERATRTTPLSLEPGDILLLHTDGVTETLGAGKERFGTERLAQALEGLAEASAPEICRGILAQVAAWGPVQDDDRTLIVARYLGAPQVPGGPSDR
jgi:sigma-B regulation protein RsbU (phosphoserine phosphatase)